MKKTILITGATDGIGFVTVKSLLKLGHHVLLHGRNAKKLAATKQKLTAFANGAVIETYLADLSVIEDVIDLANAIKQNHQTLDVLINNAGVYLAPETVNKNGLDVRFMVNTIAPYLLTQQLLPLLGNTGRIINLSSAAQAPVTPEELSKPSQLSDNTVYAKSKLALTMWSRQLAITLGSQGLVVVAINPKSFLGSKMVKDAYGIAGSDLQIGADILIKASLSDDFAQASGLYFDNDIGAFSSPHPDATNTDKTVKLTQAIEQIITRLTH